MIIIRDDFPGVDEYIGEVVFLCHRNFFSSSMYRKMAEFAKNIAVILYKFAKFTGKIGDIKTAHMTFCVVRRKGKKYEESRKKTFIIVTCNTADPDTHTGRGMGC